MLTWCGRLILVASVLFVCCAPMPAQETDPSERNAVVTWSADLLVITESFDDATADRLIQAAEKQVQENSKAAAQGHNQAHFTAKYADER